MARQDALSQPTAQRSAFRYAVVDLASAPTLRPIIPRLLSAVAEPLFARSAAPQVLEVGPWLVQTAAAPEVERVLQDMGAGTPWGFYLRTDVDILSLRQSLRKFNLAQLEGSPKQVLFRYWDPRVARIFLDNASGVQRMRFMEWIDLIEWADGSVLDKPAAADVGR